MSLPFSYSAHLQYDGGKEVDFELDEIGWRGRPELMTAEKFTLVPKPDSRLPWVMTDLGPVGESRRRLIYFRRAVGVISAGDAGMFFCLYCVGWQATIEGRNVQSLVWVFPNGSILNADEPERKHLDDILMQCLAPAPQPEEVPALPAAQAAAE